MNTPAFDLIVVGSGAAGLCAAAVAAVEGLRVLVVDSAVQVGGTTAISGGMVWVPANAHMARAGLSDSLDAARTYLDHAAPPGDDAAVREAFLTRGAEAINYLEQHTALRLRPVLRYPDYHPALPGASAGGRVLEPVPFDARVLGRHFASLRPPLPEFTLFGGMMVGRADIPHLRRAARSPRSAWRVATLLARHAVERLRAPRGTTLHLGNALVARLLKSVLDRGVTLRLGTQVTRLTQDGGRITGVEVEGGAGAELLLARRGVVLASGGLSQDATLRQRYLPIAAGTLSATAPTLAHNSGAALAQSVGAALSSGTERSAFWVPASTFTRADGTPGIFPHTVTDRGKPGLIAVDGQGRRFVNEALSYHGFVLGQLRAGAVPAWLVCDRRFLWKYGLGCIQPFTLSTAHHVASGNLKRASTLAGLALAMGVPAANFEATVARFNADARQGLDSEFGRGSDIYQRHLGDADHQPNPCVAPIEEAPFHAVAVWPADLGMAAGIVTDACARVLSASGAPVAGLWACGNDMQSVMNGAYPGPGITLGPALVFGYIAARDAARP